MRGGVGGRGREGGGGEGSEEGAGGEGRRGDRLVEAAVRAGAEKGA